MGALGFVIVGACTILVIAFVISTVVSDDDVADSTLKVDPVEIEP